MNDILLQNITVPVEVLSEWLGITPRRIQQLEKKGITFKNEVGEWRLRDSCIAYWRYVKVENKLDELHQHRTRLAKEKADRAEIDKRERLGQLVNAESYRRARERKDADIKQRLLNFEKILPQKLNGLTADAQVPIIRNEIRKLLIELAASEKPLGSDRTGGQDISAPAGSDRQPVGGPEAQAQQ